MFNAIDLVIYSLSPWWIGLITVGVMAAALELGFRIGRRVHARLEAGQKAQITTLQAAILGFLALLLGFTFSVSQGRFDTRRQLVVTEANSIETTFLRAQLLPEPYRTRMSALVADYAQTRTPKETLAQVERAIEQSERLHKQMWTQLQAVSQADDVNPATLLVLTESMNQTIDLHTMRVAAFLYRAPGDMLLLLHLGAILAVGVMGYSAGLENRRNFLAHLVMVLLIALVLMLIVDLEQPQAGMIRSSMKTLEDVQRSLSEQVGR